MPAPAAAPTQVPRALVAAPPAPEPVPFGLFSAATIAEDLDPHELNGVDYEAVCSAVVREWPPAGAVAAGGAPTSGYETKIPDSTIAVTAADPVVVYAAEQPAPDHVQHGLTSLRQRFRAGEQSTVERLLHTGMLGNRPALAPDALVLNDGRPLPVPHAIGLLEHWMASISGGVGVIHAPRWTAQVIATGGLIGSAGPRATTKLGTTLALGTGYPGTAPVTVAPPEGDDATNVWLYISRPVTLRRSTLVERDTFDPATNTGFRLVERLYVADLPCHQVAAVRTDLPLLTLPTPKEES